MTPIPHVIEKEGQSERTYDIYSRLLKDRIIMIQGEFNDHMASSVTMQLLFLQMQDPKKDVHIYINSGGGSVTAGLAIMDTMNMLTCDINTYCMGINASMATVILSSGTKGKRHILPNAHTMVHQVSGGAQGTAADIERTIGFMYGLKEKLNNILAKNCGMTIEKMERACDRDNYMTAEESVKFGLVDKVIKPNK